MDKPIELKPCPFCGGEATLKEISDRWTVHCKIGCAGTRIFNKKEQPVAAWNRRAPLPDNKALTVEELRGMEMQPVYIVFLHDGDGEWRIPRIFDSGYCSTDYQTEFVRFTDKSAEPIADYGKTWLVYRRPPEKGE